MSRTRPERFETAAEVVTWVVGIVTGVALLVGLYFHPASALIVVGFAVPFEAAVVVIVLALAAIVPAALARRKGLIWITAIAAVLWIAVLVGSKFFFAWVFAGMVNSGL